MKLSSPNLCFGSCPQIQCKRLFFLSFIKSPLPCALFVLVVLQFCLMSLLSRRFSLESSVLLDFPLYLLFLAVLEPDPALALDPYSSICFYFHFCLPKMKFEIFLLP